MKKVMISLVFLFGIFFFGIVAPISNISINNTVNLIGKVKSSAGEITIITPENKTYSEPDSGYYPATFGFENDEIDTSPEGWVNSDAANTESKIVAEKYGHKNVIQQYDNSMDDSAPGTGKAILNKYFNNQTHGTVEFYMAADTYAYGTPDFCINMGDVNLGSVLGFQMYYQGTWRYWDGQWAGNQFGSYQTQRFYHISIRFRASYGAEYEGLTSPYTWKLFIDDVEYGIFSMGHSYNINRITLFTWNWGDGLNGYWDAFGFSWDPNYNIGDNKNEGLLLSYENSTTLEWQGYSLDGNVNKTILGNSTIPMPTDGNHYIQVFGNNSIGTMYSSNLRYFTVGDIPSNKIISITTPENKTYTEPMSGYYPATYGFESDLAGSIASGWDEKSDPLCSITVVDSIFGRNKVLFFNDDTSGGFCITSHVLLAQQPYGTIEMWIRVDNPDGRLCIALFDDVAHSNLITRLFHDNSLWQHYTTVPGASITKLGGGTFDPPPGNVWHHVRIDFESSLGGYMGLSESKCQYWIDGQQSIEYNLSTNVDVGEITIYGSNSESYYDCWVDNIGFSWDSHYDVGDNLEEGLLLGFDSNVDHDWMGFSFDGQANQTILGNKTIPMPSDGLHSIQVFGNDSMGTMYESEARYFTMNAIGPVISINSPILGELNGISPPDFSLSIPDSDLDSTWYSLDGGTTNISVSGLTGTVDQAEWDKLGNGTVTITFYANDTANNVGLAEVTLRKDIVAPVITINEPNNAEIFEDPPIFDITVTEANLEEMWYTLDGGLTNITIINPDGIISQSEWNKAPDGPLTIRFYARDLAGNEAYDDVYVVKNSPSRGGSPQIPGYNIIAVVGVCCVITLILIKKNRGKMKK